MQGNLWCMFFLFEALQNKRNTGLGITMLVITKLSLSLQNTELDDYLMPNCDLLPFYLLLSTLCVVVTFKRLFREAFIILMSSVTQTLVFTRKVSSLKPDACTHK